MESDVVPDGRRGAPPWVVNVILGGCLVLLGSVVGWANWRAFGPKRLAPGHPNCAEVTAEVIEAHRSSGIRSSGGSLTLRWSYDGQSYTDRVSLDDFRFQDLKSTSELPVLCG